MKFLCSTLKLIWSIDLSFFSRRAVLAKRIWESIDSHDAVGFIRRDGVQVVTGAFHRIPEFGKMVEECLKFLSCISFVYIPQFLPFSFSTQYPFFFTLYIFLYCNNGRYPLIFSVVLEVVSHLNVGASSKRDKFWRLC